MKLNFLSKQYKKDSKLKISHNYLKEQFSDYSKIFIEIKKIVKTGDYTLGQAVDQCEKYFAKKTGARYAIGVGNGTGIRYIHTNQQESNNPMLTLNQNLGFEIKSCYILFQNQL